MPSKFTLSREVIPPPTNTTESVANQIQQPTITNHLDNWDSASFDDRRIAIDGLIDRIDATSESVQIEWKI